MKESTRWGVAGMLLGGVGGWLLHRVLGWFTHVNRPPIIVRGGSIEFETTVGWDDDGDWRPNHPQGKDVEYFLVTVTGPTPCTLMKSKHLTITYRVGARDETFRLTLKHGEPRIGPKGLLRKNGRRLHHGDSGAGHISDIRVVGHPNEVCSFTKSPDEIKIDFEYRD